MSDAEFDLPVERARVGWWVYVLVLAGAAAFIAYSFVGLISLGVFGYYATRPIDKRFDAVFDSDGIAAAVTVTLVLLPIVALLAYAGVQVFLQVQQLVDGAAGSQLPSFLGLLPTEQRETLLSAVQNPRQFLTNPGQVSRTILQAGTKAVSAIVGTLLLLALAVTLSYFLLKNDDELAASLRQLFGGRDTTAYAYAAAVDEDLESVFFGNFLFVVVMAVIAAVAYWGTNALAPQGLGVPMVAVLAFLTGVASLVPIVVGKIVYLPVVGVLAIQAMQVDGNQFVFVGGALVVYFAVLDILPQTFLQPYITGRQLDVVMMLFAYLLGPVLFGWYGFFLMPIVFVLMLEAVRIVLPELVHGDAVRPAVEMGESIGTDPESTRAEAPAGEDAVTADAETDGAETDDGITGDATAGDATTDDGRTGDATTRDAPTGDDSGADAG